MTSKIGRTRNFNDEAELPSGIALNNLTSVTVTVANSKRMNFTLSNASNQQIWVKLQAASVDDDKKGIAILRGGFYEMPTDNIYTGEVSAIAENGSPTVYLTEF